MQNHDLDVQEKCEYTHNLLTVLRGSLPSAYGSATPAEQASTSAIATNVEKLPSFLKRDVVHR